MTTTLSTSFLELESCFLDFHSHHLSVCRFFRIANQSTTLLSSLGSPTAMAPSQALIPVLVTLMLLTGVCNTLLTKYQVCRLPVYSFHVHGRLILCRTYNVWRIATPPTQRSGSISSSQSSKRKPGPAPRGRLPSGTDLEAEHRCSSARLDAGC